MILFHILDEAEVSFPFHGVCKMIDPETDEEIKIDADGFRAEYVETSRVVSKYAGQTMP